jgi:hypothetical protein
MQLGAPGRAASIRNRLGAAACMLLASSLPAMAQSDSAAINQFDATALLYGERGRTRVVEPTARVTRIYPNGQTISAQLGIDVMSGASPSGAMPAGRPQTTTSASGNVTTTSGSELPVASFRDRRIAFDGDWQRPFFGTLTPALGMHYSREKDYQSAGVNGTLSLDLMQRLTTVKVGAGYNYDDVFPVGGVRVGLSDGTARVGNGTELKRVASGLVGISRVLSRRWMIGVTGSRSVERGYLTEPYKIVSLVHPDSGVTVGSITELRPGTRDRRDVLGSTVYHFARDVLYLSYRYYWDDWQVRSHTIDLKYRHELEEPAYFEPHLRLYTQTAASFFRFGLIDGAAVPAYVTSDERLGPLRTVTVGGTYGFRVSDSPGEWTVRAEYIGQFGSGHPKYAVGAQREYNLFPVESIGSVVVGYSVNF